MSARIFEHRALGYNFSVNANLSDSAYGHDGGLGALAGGGAKGAGG